MPGMINRTESQPSLSMSNTGKAGPCYIKIRTLNIFFCNAFWTWTNVVRDEKEVLGLFLESLEAIPGHVLYCDQRAVRGEKEIHVSISNEHVVSTFDDGGKSSRLSWRYRTITMWEYVDFATN